MPHSYAVKTGFMQVKLLPDRQLRTWKLPLLLACVVPFVGGCLHPRTADYTVVVSGQTPVERTQQEARPMNLRLITFNLWGLPGVVTGTWGSRYDRVAAEIHAAEPDILLLQEVWTRRSRQSLLEFARTNSGGWFVAQTETSGRFFGQNGLLTLSRLPILRAEFQAFCTSAFPDSLMRKGALKVTVDLGNGQTANIWNVHLQSGSAKIRTRQVAQLINWVQSTTDGQVADIVGGDFNSSPESCQYRQLVDGIGPCLTSAPSGNHLATWGRFVLSKGAGQTLDYVFLRRGQRLDDFQFSSRRVFIPDDPLKPFSDHLGVEANFEFNLFSSGIISVSAAETASESFRAPDYGRVHLGVLSLAAP